LLFPVAQSAPAGGWRGELFGQILPASAAAQNPQKAFEHLAVGGPWPSAASPRTWTRKQGRIFSHWASVNRRPYRAIGPPAALLTLFISHFRQPNYLRIQALHPVLKQLNSF